MKQLDIGSVQQWRGVVPPGIRAPAVIGTVCAACASMVTFSTGATRYDPLRQTVTCSARCPACREIAHFWLIGVKPRQKSFDTVQLFTRPVAQHAVAPAGSLEGVPANVQRLYHSTLDAYNSHNHTATSVLFRRTLEVMLTERLPPAAKRGKLNRLLRDTVASTNFTQPIETFADAVRRGEQAGGPLDPELEPDADAARAMVGALGQLLDYLYRVPQALDETSGVLGNTPID